MDTKIKSMFVCPVCRKAFQIKDKSYCCTKGHCFDISSGGYVNLLLANQMNSHDPGDGKNMVNARFKFLSKGYYSALKEALEKLSLKYTLNNSKMLDLGCGEGYYTNGVINALQEANKNSQVAGIDISKSAVKLAAKNNKAGEFVVASVFHLPVADESIDLMLNCFSPLCTEEIHRALKSGGHFMYVVPADMHLWGLKSAIYDSPYKNENKETPYKGFEYKEIYHVENKINLACNEDIQNLFQMTPYFWKTSKSGKEKLSNLDTLETIISFDIHVYEKI